MSQTSLRALSFARILGLYGLPLGISAYAAIAYSVLPLGALVHPDMKASFIAHPIGIYSHVFASIAALALGPFQFSTRLRARYPNAHRFIGRVYLGVGVLIGGISGLYMARFAFGGLPGQLGFATLALFWLYTGLRALTAIRRGNVREHRRWMVRNFALTLAAVTIRLYLPTGSILGIPFEITYPVATWLCWVPNLIAAEWILSLHPKQEGVRESWLKPSTSN